MDMSEKLEMTRVLNRLLKVNYNESERKGTGPVQNMVESSTV